MPELTILVVAVVFFALVFDYINGFHDTANAIATVVATRVLKPNYAILMAAALNFAGAIVATHVAKTIAKGVVDPSQATEVVVLAAVVGGIVWNLITWKYGIPSSSSHALIGGLMGAALIHGGFRIVEWNGILNKVVYPLIGSPLAGFIIGYIVMQIIAALFAHGHPNRVGKGFKAMQVVSSALMSFSHGQNDAQKAMGIITLALVSGKFIPTAEVPLWVKLSCATAMALGTAAGGWRIMKTVGQKISRLEPVHGFAAETSGAAVILTAGHFGMSISTTHTITASILGVGASKRVSSVRWHVARNVIMAWIITIPASAAFGAVAYMLFMTVGLK